jgi:hypothetical protein
MSFQGLSPSMCADGALSLELQPGEIDGASARELYLKGIGSKGGKLEVFGEVCLVGPGQGTQSPQVDTIHLACSNSIMWNARSQKLAGDRVRIAIDLDGSPVCYADVLQRWQSDEEFRTFFIGLLADAPFSAFRWETPPITLATANRPFEFVLEDSPGLARNPDVDAFAQHFKNGAMEEVVEFPNLGKDAVMVVPCPNGPPSAYGHLADFVRHAPDSQKHALWKLVGAAMQRRLGARPVWLSTAGAGVAWLHVRLDDRPKYYGYAAYRNAR